MLTIAIVNQKGGVGKTTTAVTVAHGLALRGKRVLLVDLDAQGNVCDALGLQKHGALYDLLFAKARDAIQPSGRQHLDLVASDKSTMEAKQRLSAVDFREYRLKEALGTVTGYQVIVLDSAPGADILQLSALVACTHFLIPVALDHLALVGAADALTTTADLKRVGRFAGELLGLLPTFWERTTRESHEQLRILADTYGHLVWPPIPADVKAREAPSYGQTLFEYAPKTRALDGIAIGDHQVGGYRRVLSKLIDEVL